MDKPLNQDVVLLAKLMTEHDELRWKLLDIKDGVEKMLNNRAYIYNMTRDLKEILKIIGDI
tara:strand:+ start:1403 stop:1585 length:183 start_codon:yes stop_codon:yes gene_type:complete